MNQIVSHLPYLNLTCFILLFKNDNLELLQAYLAYALNANEIMYQARLDIIQFDRPTTCLSKLHESKRHELDFNQ